MTSRRSEEIKNIFGKSCVLFFPPNRFEDPAWLNESNLTARARFMESKTLQGDTNRKVINYSTLLDNQNWLFEAIFDSRAFEGQESYETLQLEGEPRPTRFPVFSGYHGEASRSVEMAFSLMARVLKLNKNLRLTIGRRRNRVVGISEHDDLTFGENLIVPNIFQLSSGETSLISLFLSILRDFDLCGEELRTTMDIRGVVIVDEIDLHLHTDHQYEVLPDLMRMFPNVQFIVTTHSPLFVLGLRKLLGEGGFDLYQLPEGQQISPEEFTEFGRAYNSFSDTRRYSEDIRQAIEKSRKPIIFAEGITDIKYIEKAAEHMEQLKVFDKIQLRDGQGFGGLNKVSKHFDTALSEITP